MLRALLLLLPSLFAGAGEPGSPPAELGGEWVVTLQSCRDAGQDVEVREAEAILTALTEGDWCSVVVKDQLGVLYGFWMPGFTYEGNPGFVIDSFTYEGNPGYTYIGFDRDGTPLLLGR